MHSFLGKILTKVFLVPIFLVVTVLFYACENDMKDINRIASLQQEEAVDISKHVEVTYSDSAVVKAVLKAPEMRVYHDSTSNNEFPKGVLLIFYDPDGQETQRITSDYAIRRNNEELTEFKKDVVVTRADGSVINTEELFYDEKNKTCYNHVPIIFFFNDERGNMEATSFTSDIDFQHIDGENMTGYVIQRGQNSFFPSLLP